MNADGSGAKEILRRASEPTFSPDGTKIAYYGWTDGIYVADADGSNPRKILSDGNTGFLEWSHNGRWIAFSVRPGGQGNIAIDAIAPDGTGRRPVVVGWSPSWSPDDTLLAFQTCRNNICGIYKANSGGGDATPIVGDDGGLAAWSPDGKMIVYQKEVDGQKQLFLINADGSGKKQLTSGAALHVDATWSPDGNFIFYRSPEGGSWGIWRMNQDGSNRVRFDGDFPPGDWPYDRIAATR
jgi:TolB protein